MLIEYDGIAIELKPGETLYDGIIKAGLESDDLACRPLAARIGGDTYNLSFRPNRDCAVILLRYGDEEGMRVYERTLQFVMLMAAKRLYPDVSIAVNYSICHGLYVTSDKPGGFLIDDVKAICDECRSIVNEDIPLVRHRLDIKEAIRYFETQKRQDKVDILKWRKFNYFDSYATPEYMDYFYGEMCPSTGYASVFDLAWQNGSMLLMMPDTSNPNVAAKYVKSPKIQTVLQKSEAWGKLMTCANASDLNNRVEDGSIHELIRVNEALHEREFVKIAEQIVKKQAKAILIAGPSSSGKTTSANRIATQLRVLGLDPIMLSLDNYYIDRDICPRDEYGNIDLEHIEALDIALFNDNLDSLMNGHETQIPTFDFKTGKRAESSATVKLHNDQPLIIEGIHGLNPLLISENVDKDKLFRVYVTALTTMNLDDHNRIKTTDVRLFRRIVRDFEARNATALNTLSMWPSVREGEERWIFTYQEKADYVFNSTLHYEICVLKRYVYPLLQTVPKDSQYYSRARSMIKFLNYFLEADVEPEIPPTSILREFIGGNSFYR